MAIASTPLIPLNQVQADPQARFQRFGVNDARLFGKPINFAPEAAPRPQRPRIADRAQPKRADETAAGPARSALQAIRERPKDFQVPADKPPRAGSAPWIGSNLDVIA